MILAGLRVLDLEPTRRGNSADPQGKPQEKLQGSYGHWPRHAELCDTSLETIKASQITKRMHTLQLFELW